MNPRPPRDTPLDWFWLRLFNVSPWDYLSFMDGSCPLYFVDGGERHGVYRS